MLRNIYPLGDYNTKQIKELAAAASDPELDPEDRMDSTLLYYLRPDAAPDPVRFIRDVPPERAAFIIPDAFAGSLGPVMAARLTLPQLEKIGARGDINLMETIKMQLVVAEEKNPENSDIKDAMEYIGRSPAWQL